MTNGINGRRPLPNRRNATTISFVHVDGTSSRGYLVSYGLFGPADVSEVFLNASGKLGSAADVAAADAAVAVSLALQYGCPLEVLRTAMKRNPDGTAMGAVGAALDAVHLDMLDTFGTESEDPDDAA